MQSEEKIRSWNTYTQGHFFPHSAAFNEIQHVVAILVVLVEEEIRFHLWVAGAESKSLLKKISRSHIDGEFHYEWSDYYCRFIGLFGIDLIIVATSIVHWLPLHTTVFILQVFNPIGSLSMPNFSNTMELYFHIIDQCFRFQWKQSAAIAWRFEVSVANWASFSMELIETSLCKLKTKKNCSEILKEKSIPKVGTT